MISVAVAQVLKQQREPCNRWFAEARHRYPHLDAAAFTQFLQIDAEALLQAIEEHHPDQLEAVVLTLYRHGLQLAGVRWCGDDSRFPLLQDAWRYWLHHWHALIVQAPEKVLVAISHALRELQTHSAADAQRWLQQMTVLATLHEEADEWLLAGQVQAWHCGLAHYRHSALQQADFLPEMPLLFSLDAAHLFKWPLVRAHYNANRWWTPKKEPEPLVEQCRIGGLAGMGGVFVALPKVFARHDGLFVQSGHQTFELFADAYGASLQRVQDMDSTQLTHTNDNVQYSRNRLALDGCQRTISDINTITSIACTQDTVAVTSAESFQIIVFSRVGDAV